MKKLKLLQNSRDDVISPNQYSCRHLPHSRERLLVFCVYCPVQYRTVSIQRTSTCTRVSRWPQPPPRGAPNTSCYNFCECFCCGLSTIGATLRTALYSTCWRAPLRLLYFSEKMAWEIEKEFVQNYIIISQKLTAISCKSCANNLRLRPFQNVCFVALFVTIILSRSICSQCTAGAFSTSTTRTKARNYATVTTEQILSYASKQGTILSITILGPAYRAVARASHDESIILGYCNGFIRPTGKILHLDAMQVFKTSLQTAAATNKDFQRCGGTIFGIGLLLGCLCFRHGNWNSLLFSGSLMQAKFDVMREFFIWNLNNFLFWFMYLSYFGFSKRTRQGMHHGRILSNRRWGSSTCTSRTILQTPWIEYC